MRPQPQGEHSTASVPIIDIWKGTGSWYADGMLRKIFLSIFIKVSGRFFSRALDQVGAQENNFRRTETFLLRASGDEVARPSKVAGSG